MNLFQSFSKQYSTNDRYNSIGDNVEEEDDYISFIEEKVSDFRQEQQKHENLHDVIENALN